MYVGSTAKLIVVATVAATVARQCVRHRLRTGYRLVQATGYRLQYSGATITITSTALQPP